jgi:hypothetical protein
MTGDDAYESRIYSVCMPIEKARREKKRRVWGRIKKGVISKSIGYFIMAVS